MCGLRLVTVLAVGIAMMSALDTLAQSEPQRIVIAHRGASGYLPEHTLAAKVLAHAQGADYLEQDVVLSADGVPIVLHDIYLGAVTDVARVFPDRHREDGRYYAIDFTLAEIRRLAVGERVDPANGRAVYPGRFPAGKSRFGVPTLAEEIELIQGLNRSSGRNVGIYTEVKRPAWHRRQGHDISRIVLDVLAQYGYRSKQDAAYVQCFDPGETRRMREELGCPLRLIQLIGENEWEEADADFDQLRTTAGLAEVAEYADGIGPWIPHVIARVEGGGWQPTGLAAEAHKQGLAVHPFTLRADALPEGAASFDDALHGLWNVAQADGVFTDFPDLALGFRTSGTEAE